MNLSDRHQATSTFFADCQIVLERKGALYADAQDAWKAVVHISNITGRMAEEELFAGLAKHIAGLRMALHSSSPAAAAEIQHRCLDAANYCALIATYCGWDRSLPPEAMES